MRPFSAIVHIVRYEFGSSIRKHVWIYGVYTLLLTAAYLFQTSTFALAQNQNNAINPEVGPAHASANLQSCPLPPKNDAEFKNAFKNYDCIKADVPLDPNSVEAKTIRFTIEGAQNAEIKAALCACYVFRTNLGKNLEDAVALQNITAHTPSDSAPPPGSTPFELPPMPAVNTPSDGGSSGYADAGYVPPNNSTNETCAIAGADCTASIATDGASGAGGAAPGAYFYDANCVGDNCLSAAPNANTAPLITRSLADRQSAAGARAVGTALTPPPSYDSYVADELTALHARHTTELETLQKRYGANPTDLNNALSAAYRRHQLELDLFSRQYPETKAELYPQIQDLKFLQAATQESLTTPGSPTITSTLNYLGDKVSGYANNISNYVRTNSQTAPTTQAAMQQELMTLQARHIEEQRVHEARYQDSNTSAASRVAMLNRQQLELQLFKQQYPSYSQIDQVDQQIADLRAQSAQYPSSGVHDFPAMLNTIGTRVGSWIDYLGTQLNLR